MTTSITESHGKLLLGVARQAIKHKLDDRPLPAINLEEYPFELPEKGASFVTLTLDGVLRGCVGSIIATDPLVIDVQQRAVAAAFQDPRFPPVTKDDYSRLKVEVSCLTLPVKLNYQTPEELVQGLGTAFACDEPVFVDVKTEPEVENLPPVFHWLKAAKAKSSL